MNIFKKLDLYLKYRSGLLNNKKDLFNVFGLKIDMVNRMYTVINIPDTLGEPYNMRKDDIDKMTEEHLKTYFSKLSEFLNQIGLSEMYDLEKPIERVDKLSYLVVIGFKFLDTRRMHARALTILLILMLLTTSYFLLN